MKSLQSADKSLPTQTGSTQTGSTQIGSTQTRFTQTPSLEQAASPVQKSSVSQQSSLSQGSSSVQQDSSSTTSSTPAAAPQKFLIFPIIVLVLAQMGTSGDHGAVSIATQILTTQLHANMHDIELANMIYSLVTGALMVGGGLLGTIIGWKKNFRIGAFLCSAGEIVMALSLNMNMFIWGGRILVGLGASLMIPSVLGLVPQMYSARGRMIVFGWIGAAAAGLSALLPFILGAIMGVAGFRWTFAILGLYFLTVFLMSFKLPPIPLAGKGLHFDYVGTILAAAGLFLFLMGISSVAYSGLWKAFPEAPFTIWGLSPAPFEIVAGIIILIILIIVEKPIQDKWGICLIPQSLIRTPQVIAGVVGSIVVFFFMGLQAILIGPYLQLVSGWSPLGVGFIWLVTGIPLFIFSAGLPRYFPKINPRHEVQVGYFVMAVGTAVLGFSIAPEGMSLWGLYIGSILAGSGAGIVSAQANTIVALAVDKRDASQSGGVQSSMRNVGQAIGVALLGTIVIFGIKSTISSQLYSSPDISPTVAHAIVQKNITLTGDKQFEEAISSIHLSSSESQKVLNIYKEGRTNATRWAYGIATACILLGELTTPWITIFGKTPRQRDVTDVFERKKSIVGSQK